MGSKSADLTVRMNDRTKWSEALFASLIPSGTEPDLCTVTAAIRWAVREYDGICGCAAEMAAAYGKDPDVAAARMRWARRVVMSVSPAEFVPPGFSPIRTSA